MLERKDATYELLTRKFLSSLDYRARPDSTSTIGTISFCIFNTDYEFTKNEITEMLRLPQRDRVPCEAPIETEWDHEACLFGTKLMVLLLFIRG